MSLSVDQQAVAAKAYVKAQISALPDGPAILSDKDFLNRLDTNFITIFAIFAELYGYRHDCLAQLTQLVTMAARSYRERDPELKKLDKARELDPEWYLSEKMVGGVCYVDRYAGDLEGVKAKIPYFQELGLTYLHLMPLFLTPEPLSDGGYAVSSYRHVKPALGDMAQLRDLAASLRKAGISLVVDLVFNHTSNEHEWAKKAIAGDKEYEAYYWFFPNRSIPSEFERTTREIFPDDHPGSFICLPDGRWVWSTFYHFQWDLNYSNPAVFRAMAGEMLYLANVGIDFFRMDAVAFIWKRMNTDCENLPEGHKLLRAFNSLCRIAAPSVLFKSEAIVHPDAVVQYIDTYECQLSYNPLQMALTWEVRCPVPVPSSLPLSLFSPRLFLCRSHTHTTPQGLATRDASMLAQAIERRHNIARSCTWVNYVRSHDDIGWTFADEDALELGHVGSDHRRFLNAFYVNRHPGSFARGVPFQDNPKTGDCRISGTTASLAGLESGQAWAVERILLAYSLAFSTGGIPLIYLGDEVGQLNDYSYLNDPSKMDDSRWVNRPSFPADRYAERHDPHTIPGRLYAGFKHLIALRKAAPELAGGRAVGFFTANSKVLGYQRPGRDRTILCLANFSEEWEWVGRERFMGLPERAWDLVGGWEVELRSHGIHLKPYQYLWLRY
jgi:amylosucrase